MFFILKNKFKLQKRPLIINYGVEPKQDWIFKKSNIKDLSENIILQIILQILFTISKKLKTLTIDFL